MTSSQTTKDLSLHLQIPLLDIRTLGIGIAAIGYLAFYPSRTVLIDLSRVVAHGLATLAGYVRSSSSPGHPLNRKMQIGKQPPFSALQETFGRFCQLNENSTLRSLFA